MGKTPEISSDILGGLQSTDESIKRRTVKEVAEYYQYLVEALARTRSRGLPGFIELEELRSAGQVGLMRAIERYNPEVGAFSKYASILIYGSIVDSIRKHDFAPRGLRTQQRKLIEAETALRNDGNHSPSEDDLAEVLGWDVDEVQKIRSKVERAKIQLTHPAMVPTVRDEQSQWVRDSCQELANLLSDEPDDHLEVMVRRYFLNQTLKDIAADTGLTLPNVTQIHRAVLSRVYASMVDSM